MQNLKIETGLVTYNLNDAVQVTINPTDVAFAEKLYNIFDILDKKQDEYMDNIQRKKDTRELFDYGREMDKEMRGYIFTLFDEDIVTPLIGDISITALAGGMPIWANILMAFVDQMDAAVSQNNDLGKKRIAKYTKKYHN